MTRLKRIPPAVRHTSAERSDDAAFEDKHRVRLIYAWGTTDTSPLGTVAHPPATASGEQAWGRTAHQARPLPGRAPSPLRPGEAASATELWRFAAAAGAKWQVPERWAFLPEVPKTSVGTFDKKRLRTRYAEGRLDIAEAAGP